MKSYLNIIQEVLDEGLEKHPVRFQSHVKMENGQPPPVERATIGLPCVTFEHNMGGGFPLLTSKKMDLSKVAVELEAFLKGIKSKAWLKARGCGIWNAWCPPADIPEIIRLNREATKEFMASHDNLGKYYGVQWRDFADSGYDQLAVIADRLKQNPYDRRMVCSAWAPHLFDEMALVPCHILWNVVVYGDTISLSWFQRSCDLMLGVPYNIASYGLLLMLLAQHSGLRPWRLHATLADCHIYEDQIDGAKEQLEREPKALPFLKLPQTNGNGEFDIRNWDHTQYNLYGYDPHPPLKFQKAMVT